VHAAVEVHARVWRWVVSTRWSSSCWIAGRRAAARPN